MEFIIALIFIFSLWSCLALIYTSFHFVVLGKKYEDKSIQIMGWVGFLAVLPLVIQIIMIIVVGYTSLAEVILIVVFSIMLAIYIGVLSFNSYKKFNNIIIGLFGIPMIFISLLMGINFFSAFTSNDGWGALIGAILYLPPLGAILIVVAKMTLVFLNVYKKEKSTIDIQNGRKKISRI